MKKRKKTISSFTKKFNQLQQQLEKFSQSPIVIAVSKYVGASEIAEAYAAGFRDFGENRVPDLLEKATLLQERCPDIRWHFIGNIQSNKIKDLMSLKSLYAIHSLDSLKHLKMIGERALAPLKIFIQINTSGETQKGGISSKEELSNYISELQHYPYLFFEGLMTMASVGGDKNSAKKSFIELKELSSHFPNARLSMGMSGDYEIALEQGSHYIRVGSLIFRD